MVDKGSTHDSVEPDHLCGIFLHAGGCRELMRPPSASTISRQMAAGPGRSRCRCRRRKRARTGWRSSAEMPGPSSRTRQHCFVTRGTHRDEGPGISAELRQRLFAPFSAGDTGSGSGLGLAICREIVLALDGRISARQPTVVQENSAQVLGLDAAPPCLLSAGYRHNS